MRLWANRSQAQDSQTGTGGIRFDVWTQVVQACGNYFVRRDWIVCATGSLLGQHKCCRRRFANNF